VNSHPGKAKEKEIIMATAYTRIPPYTQLTDASTVAISGPDGLATDYLFDAQSRALWFKDAQAATFLHGTTHISEDPIPGATCDTPGLLSANDKCKLDALLQTRIGVLGFQGAGFPDDGGWLQGDIILAAGDDSILDTRDDTGLKFLLGVGVELFVEFILHHALCDTLDVIDFERVVERNLVANVCALVGDVGEGDVPRCAVFAVGEFGRLSVSR
jgi:hypothetical protein